MRIGDLDVTSLVDGRFRLDGGAMFGTVPKTMWERRAPADGLNRIALALRPLLVETGSQRVLIDAGVGEAMSAKAREIYAIEQGPTLDESLAARGIARDDIDLVVATHLHWDHAGGFTEVVGGESRPRFERARYAVRRGEWDDATHPHERSRASYLPETFLPLQTAGVVDFNDGDADVASGIRVRQTGGHTRHHQIVEIRSGGRVAIFAADLLPTAAHVDLPWIMGYDLYPMETLEFKRAFLREAIEGEYVIFFEHDPAIVAGVIRADGRRLWVESVEG